ncbi:MAG: hypothetical protein AAGF20_09230 [Pseudomonadota bacterium]
MKPGRDVFETLIPAALSLAETDGWNSLTVSAVVAEAKLTLKDVGGPLVKDELSAAVDPYFDTAMAEGSFDPDETARTRLFDVIMMRFEKMEDHRDGLMAFMRWRDRSLAGLNLRVRARKATARWALTCVGLDRSGPLPTGLQVVGLGLVLARAERAWRQETSADLTRTMAALDAALLQAEERVTWLARRKGRKTSSETSESDPAQDAPEEANPA